jgi:mono/diheme cytochrome c family protein
MWLFLLFCGLSFAHQEADWREGTPIPPGGRANPYQLEEREFFTNNQKGRIHAQIYPVEVTGMLPPVAPIKKFFNTEEKGFLKSLARFFLGNFFHIKSINDLMDWVGLHPYPSTKDSGVYSVPYPNGKRPSHPMGYGEIHSREGIGFSISCAACHSSNLFGKTVLGMSNRFPKSNEAFYYAKRFVPMIPASILKSQLDISEGELSMFLQAQRNLKSIGVKKPIVAGLDTSLAQVALSLSRRNLDAYASKNPELENNPREELLEKFVADSKPSVWWNVKYKNRWLSDGSVVSGNPIYTNILWNEIGRGADLNELEDWLEKNKNTIQELTTAVFSSEAPRITDFFPAEKISLLRAKRGEKIFLRACAGCHGIYDKAWSYPEFGQKSLAEKIQTVRVRYHQLTPVIDVGTDPQRWMGMASLEQLNDLKISRVNGIRVEAQRGYVPPPLVGIWARWPYFHNNSIPNLCALLTAGEHRPKKFYMGEANSTRDFDFNCNGYPLKNVPTSWKKRKMKFNAKKKGLSNLGHDEGIFLKNGKEIFTLDQKFDLVQFLQTL